MGGASRTPRYNTQHSKLSSLPDLNDEIYRINPVPCDGGAFGDIQQGQRPGGQIVALKTLRMFGVQEHIQKVRDNDVQVKRRSHRL